MREIEPDAGELLAKALDLVVGATMLARYAATRTSDRQLRRVFRQVALRGDQQESLLKEKLAGYVGADQPGGGRTAGYVGVGILVAGVAGLALAARALGADPLELLGRGLARLVGAAGQGLGGSNAAAPQRPARPRS